MDAAERELFASAFERAVSTTAGVEVDGLLADLGWDDALQDDPQAAVSVLFGWQGRAAAATGALDRVLCAALSVEPSAVVLPVLGSTEPPGRVVGDAIEVHGLALGPGEADARVLVAVGDGAHDCQGLERRAVDGLDPFLGLTEVTGTVALAAAPSVAIGPWDDAVAAGQRALAHELVGAASAMLELAREHALERIQFGVPIASFQAVRHRLADAFVAVESARAALDAAWKAGTPFDAAVAKAIAGRSGRLVAKHAQQVLAGIGFTLEHPLHRYVRRVRVLDGLLGDARTLTRELGERLLADRGLPAILPLTAP